MFKFDYPIIESWNRAGRNSDRYYDTQKTAKEHVAYLMKRSALQCGLKKPYDCPVGCAAIFYKAYPKRFSKLKRKTPVLYWDTKPDSDNLEKFLFDTMEKQAGLLANDSKICAKISLKLWGPHDRTVFIMDRWTPDSRFYFSNCGLGINDCIFHYGAGTFAS